MRRVLAILGIVVGVLIAAAVVIYATGSTLFVLAFAFKPHHGWDPSLKAPPPDYADVKSWAALPGHPGLAAYHPRGTPQPPASPAVDVFFVHPTGDMSGADWNSNLDPNSQTEENTKWMMANQASAFSRCCAIYAPRYREASIFTYFSSPPDIFKQTMDLAYGDVDRAFTWFLAHTNGRPFIIASHSQGTFHAFRLIKERIDGTPLAERMVAAYLIGGGITDKDADGLKTVHPCAGASDLHCMIHWATWGEGGSGRREGDKLLCINPLTWTRDGTADKSQHQGGVPSSGRFRIRMWSDTPWGTEFPPLGPVVKNETGAACRDGLLTVADQKGGPFDGLDLGGKNYHGLDYPLFHEDIAQNADARIAVYFAH